VFAHPWTSIAVPFVEGRDQRVCVVVVVVAGGADVVVVVVVMRLV